MRMPSASMRRKAFGCNAVDVAYAGLAFNTKPSIRPPPAMPVACMKRRRENFVRLGLCNGAGRVTASKTASMAA